MSNLDEIKEKARKWDIIEKFCSNVTCEGCPYSLHGECSKQQCVFIDVFLAINKTPTTDPTRLMEWLEEETKQNHKIIRMMIELDMLSEKLKHPEYFKEEN